MECHQICMQSNFSYYGIFQNQAPSSFFSNFPFLPSVSCLPSTFYSFPTVGEFPTLFLDLKFWPYEFFFISITLLIFPFGRPTCKTFDIFPLVVRSETRWSSELLDQKKESCHWSPVSNEISGSADRCVRSHFSWGGSVVEIFDWVCHTFNELLKATLPSHGVTRRRTEA